MCGTKRKSPSPPAPTSNSSTIGQNKLEINVGKAQKLKIKDDGEWGIVWRNVIIMSYIHLIGAYGLYVWFSGQLLWSTIVLGMGNFGKIINTCVNKYNCCISKCNKEF